MKKRELITMVLAGLLGLAQAQNNSNEISHVKSASTICRVVGNGRKVAAVVLEYDAAISNKSLSASCYSVAGR